MEEIIEAMFESARTAASCRRATGTEDVQSAKSQVEIILGELVRTLQKTLEQGLSLLSLLLKIRKSSQGGVNHG